VTTLGVDVDIQGPVTMSIGRYANDRWTLTELMRTNVAERPDDIAIRSETESWTYRQLHVDAARMASSLVDAGVRRGDRVLMMMDNSAEWAVAFVALSYIGAASVPTNTMYRGNILAHVVRNSGATVAVVDSNHVEVLTRFDEGRLGLLVVRGHLAPEDVHGEREVLDYSALRRHELALEPVDVAPWDVACVAYTSGTTGDSKGVNMTHAHLVQASDPFTVTMMGQGEHEVIYVAVPLFHLFGVASVVSSWILGGQAVIASRFSASTYIADAAAAGATHLQMVAAMAEFLLQQPPSPTDAQHSIRTAYILPMPARHREFSQRFGVDVHSSFGSTEVGCLIATGGDPEAVARMSVGKPRPGITVRLVDSHDVEVPVGQPGEAIARHVLPWTLCSSYLGDPEATASGWRNGWWHTGDLLVQDADGYYYFVDRKKDAIRRRGENVSSVEVEREVMAHDHVQACAVVAVDFSDFEQEIKVFVELVPGSQLTESELIHFLIDRLPRYAVPRFVEVVTDLPRTPTSKVRKHELRGRPNDQAWDREAAGIIVPR
jgi:crotonobetaine/carnitine-CoA ligase